MTPSPANPDNRPLDQRVNDHGIEINLLHLMTMDVQREIQEMQSSLLRLLKRIEKLEGSEDPWS